MRTENEIKDYKSYLKSQITRMEDKEYGSSNRSLLRTYKVKLELLNLINRDDIDRPDRLSLCKWLAGY